MSDGAGFTCKIIEICAALGAHFVHIVEFHHVQVGCNVVKLDSFTICQYGNDYLCYASERCFHYKV